MCFQPLYKIKANVKQFWCLIENPSKMGYLSFPAAHSVLISEHRNITNRFASVFKGYLVP